MIPGALYPDPQYRYLDLVHDTAGSMFNIRVSRPNAINNAGVVVGRLGADDLDRGPSQAFVYDTERRELTLLAVPGARSAEATDINNLGQIVGNFTDASGADRGFLFSAGTYTVIDRPGYANGGTRLGGINDAGSIVGSSYDYSNPFSFIYRNGSFEDFTADNRYTVAADINSADRRLGGGVRHAAGLYVPGRAGSDPGPRRSVRRQHLGLHHQQPGRDRRHGRWLGVQGQRVGGAGTCTRRTLACRLAGLAAVSAFACRRSTSSTTAIQPTETQTA